MILKSIHLYVSGRVQGVGFRYSTLRAAQSIQIVGWVRNTVDGKVEIEAQAEEASLNAFIKWCHQGPASSKVDAVEVISQGTIQEITFNKFEIR